MICYRKQKVLKFYINFKLYHTDLVAISYLKDENPIKYLQLYAQNFIWESDTISFGSGNLVVAYYLHAHCQTVSGVRNNDCWLADQATNFGHFIRLVWTIRPK